MTHYTSFKELLDYPVQAVVDETYAVEDYLALHLCNFVEFPTNFNVNKAIKVHVIQDFCYDGRRVWQLFYVTFKDELVMFCYSAGREGRDSYSSKLFNTKAFTDMLLFIAEQDDYYDESFKLTELNTICNLVHRQNITITNLDEKADDFINFYGNKLNDVFSNW